MAKLIILRGNSGSGKTSAAKALQRRFGRGTLLISQDTVRREMLWAADGAGTKALPLLIHLLEYGRKNCDVTILEGILDSECYRDLFEAAVQEYGENVFAFYYDIPFDETLLRHRTKPNRGEFGEAEMRRWWKEKDYAGVIPERTIERGMSLSDTVEMIFCMVSGT